MKRRDESQPPRHPSRHPSRRPPLGRSRWRGLLKWSGTLACLLILLAAAACLKWGGIEVSDGATWAVTLAVGSLGVTWGTTSSSWGNPIVEFYSQGIRFVPRYWTGQRAIDAWARYGLLPKSDGVTARGGTITVPLWIPFLLIGLPTGWLWWRDRRRVPAGCCACGYDLTGNVSGICPECGRAVAGAVLSGAGSPPRGQGAEPGRQGAEPGRQGAEPGGPDSA
jgi:hypothetical protein